MNKLMQPIGKVHSLFRKVEYTKAQIPQKKLSHRFGQEPIVLNADRLMETIPLRLQMYRLKLVNGRVLVPAYQTMRVRILYLCTL